APEPVEAATPPFDSSPLRGAPPAPARLCPAPEAVPNGPRGVVLSHRLWARRFAADPALIGRSILVNGEPRTVIGVLPESFRLVLPPEHFVLDQPDLWAPEQADLASIPRNYTLHTLFRRRRPGATAGRPP